jgi:hypothetical protein
VTKVAERKHHVFSARTTEEGLRALNELKDQRGIDWDELLIDAVCARYGLGKGVMAISKPAKAERPDRPKSDAAKTKQQADTAG